MISWPCWQAQLNARVNCAQFSNGFQSNRSASVRKHVVLRRHDRNSCLSFNNGYGGAGITATKRAIRHVWFQRVMQTPTAIQLINHRDLIPELKSDTNETPSA